MGVFVRPGPDILNWVSRTNYPLQGVVQDGAGRDVHLRRAPLRARYVAHPADDPAPGRICLAERAV